MRELKLVLTFIFLSLQVAPSRVRELKLYDDWQKFITGGVAPSRVRELKLRQQLMYGEDLKSHLHGCVN